MLRQRLRQRLLIVPGGRYLNARWSIAHFSTRGVLRNRPQEPSETDPTQSSSKASDRDSQSSTTSRPSFTVEDLLNTNGFGTAGKSSSQNPLERLEDFRRKLLETKNNLVSQSHSKYKRDEMIRDIRTVLGKFDTNGLPEPSLVPRSNAASTLWLVWYFTRMGPLENKSKKVAAPATSPGVPAGDPAAAPPQPAIESKAVETPTPELNCDPLLKFLIEALKCDPAAVASSAPLLAQVIPALATLPTTDAAIQLQSRALIRTILELIPSHSWKDLQPRATAAVLSAASLAFAEETEFKPTAQTLELVKLALQIPAMSGEEPSKIDCTQASTATGSGSSVPFAAIIKGVGNSPQPKGPNDRGTFTKLDDLTSLFTALNTLLPDPSSTDDEQLWKGAHAVATALNISLHDVDFNAWSRCLSQAKKHAEVRRFEESVLTWFAKSKEIREALSAKDPIGEASGEDDETDEPDTNTNGLSEEGGEERQGNPSPGQRDTLEEREGDSALEANGGGGGSPSPSPSGKEVKVESVDELLNQVEVANNSDSAEEGKVADPSSSTSADPSAETKMLLDLVKPPPKTAVPPPSTGTGPGAAASPTGSAFLPKSPFLPYALSAALIEKLNSDIPNMGKDSVFEGLKMYLKAGIDAAVTIFLKRILLAVQQVSAHLTVAATDQLLRILEGLNDIIPLYDSPLLLVKDIREVGSRALTQKDGEHLSAAQLLKTYELCFPSQGVFKDLTVAARRLVTSPETPMIDAIDITLSHVRSHGYWTRLMRNDAVINALRIRLGVESGRRPLDATADDTAREEQRAQTQAQLQALLKTVPLSTVCDLYRCGIIPFPDQLLIAEDASTAPFTVSLDDEEELDDEPAVRQSSASSHQRNSSILSRSALESIVLRLIEDLNPATTRSLTESQPLVASDADAMKALRALLSLIRLQVTELLPDDIEVMLNDGANLTSAAQSTPAPKGRQRTPALAGRVFSLAAHLHALRMLAFTPLRKTTIRVAASQERLNNFIEGQLQGIAAALLKASDYLRPDSEPKGNEKPPISLPEGNPSVEEWLSFLQQALQIFAHKLGKVLTNKIQATHRVAGLLMSELAGIVAAKLTPTQSTGGNSLQCPSAWRITKEDWLRFSSASIRGRQGNGLILSYCVAVQRLGMADELEDHLAKFVQAVPVRMLGERNPFPVLLIAPKSPATTSLVPLLSEFFLENLDRSTEELKVAALACGVSIRNCRSTAVRLATHIKNRLVAAEQTSEAGESRSILSLSCTCLYMLGRVGLSDTVLFAHIASLSIRHASKWNLHDVALLAAALRHRDKENSSASPLYHAVRDVLLNSAFLSTLSSIEDWSLLLAALPAAYTADVGLWSSLSNRLKAIFLELESKDDLSGIETLNTVVRCGFCDAGCFAHAPNTSSQTSTEV